MASLPELARFQTLLDREEVEHLQRLVAEWGLLADLSFSDLILWAPTADDDQLFVALAHIRPVTGQTIYRSDRAGEIVPAAERPFIAAAFESHRRTAGEIEQPSVEGTISVECIPVRGPDGPIAVISREASATAGRSGDLEATYLGLFARFADMTAEGAFPYAGPGARTDYLPRVPDGVMLLDGSGRVVFSSPNAVSALLRLGVAGNAEGLTLAELGIDEAAVRQAFAGLAPATDEVERGSEASVVLRCLPVTAAGSVTGCVVMMRDISELRRRDRLLLSKDATIREIHHRVKNNLQTISSLLRLQGRRLSSPEAKAAVEESVRRIRSIALVHETLSRDAGEDVAFVEIVRPLVRMVEEGYSSADRPLHFKVLGDAGNLPAAVATPLAVVLTELLQNVVDHAYPPGDEPGSAEAAVELDDRGTELRVVVRDDGVGLAAGLSVDSSSGLGLQIVRTMVETELGGTIDVRPASGGVDRRGTVVEVRVPVDHTGPDAHRPPAEGGR